MNGTVLGGRYELLEKIGEGGMSEVFKARCNKLNRFVAVKILKKEFCNNEEIDRIISPKNACDFLLQERAKMKQLL